MNLQATRQNYRLGQLSSAKCQAFYAAPDAVPAATYDAALGGHMQIIRALLDAGATADAKDRRGRTPAQYADRAKHADCAALLRGAGLRYV